MLCDLINKLSGAQLFKNNEYSTS